MDAKQLISRARTALVLDQPFFGALALRLRLVDDPSCETAWTDGTSLGFNAAFVESLSKDELKGLIAHEVMHCAAGHPWRRDARDLEQWNVACDYAINAVLRDANFKLPEGGLLDSQYDGRSSEWIYSRLPPQSKQNGGKSGGQFGEVRDAPTPGNDKPGDPQTQTEADWSQAVAQTAKMCEGRGTLPAGVKRTVELSKPSVDWRSILWRFVQTLSADDYTWRRPNTRYVPHGLYLPSLRSETMGRIVIAIDTSGSIDQVALSQFSAELAAIHADLKPETTEVVYCDTRVNRSETFGPYDPLEINAEGGGGTDFRPVFEHVRESGDEPVCLVFFTDLDGSFPSDVPDYPVLWANYGRERSVPFGELVSLE